ncbi:MAG TPA: serine/threonine-protein kinase, partial [Nannocystaceae bacterium]|nr:serine/threonine-protein kinase [Nannocystaceae bacterium]
MTSGTDDTLAAEEDFAAEDRESASAATRPSHRLDRGEVIGRYVVLAKLGAGGMGVVYAAYDPELDRKVALKLLLDDPESGASASVGRAQLLGEAKALAKFSHPEIVGVHDVGVHDAAVWIAMEFVEGRTLRAWADAATHSWREILDVMAAVGRGVAAAHVVGLVHGDLKPENVMVVDRGGVKVMDFGLTRPRGAPALDDLDADDSGALDQATVFTRGGLHGTPAYMAAEQFSGDTVTEAADQFAFCVTLWELLFRQRPFAGRSLVELAAAVLDGTLVPAPARTDVPSWLRRACERGMARDPARRWPSMQALLAELERGRSSARRRKLAIAGASVAGIALLALAAYQIDHARRVADCEAAGAAIADSWNDARESELRDALIAAGGAHASDTVGRLMPWLDAHANAWQTTRTDVCIAATVDQRAPWDARMLERAVWCLEERRDRFDALVVELAAGGSHVGAHAVQAAARLEAVEPCRNTTLLDRLPEPPVDDREAIAEARALLAKSSVLQTIGEYSEGLRASESALARAQELQWPPLVAAATVRVGSLIDSKGEFAAAEQTLERGYFAAIQAGALESAADAAMELVLAVGQRQARHAEGLRWARHAEGVLAMMPERDELRHARLLTRMSMVHAELAELDEGARLGEAGLALEERLLGAEHPSLAFAIIGLANVYFAAGDYPRAKSQYARAIALAENALGPWHPSVAMGLNNLANIHYTMGEYDEAAQLYARALAIDEDLLGPQHTDVAADLSNLGSVYYATGEHEKSEAFHLRALAIDEQAVGPAHPTVAVTLNNLGNLYTRTHRLAEARTMHARALAIREQALGAAHPSVGNSLDNLGDIELEAGGLARAETFYRRALAIHEAALGPEHPKLATALLGLAKVSLLRHDTADAVTLTERALALRERGKAGPVALADARFVLARAWWESEAARPLAVATAARAHAEYRVAKGAGSMGAAEVDAWLRKIA